MSTKNFFFTNPSVFTHSRKADFRINVVCSMFSTVGFLFGFFMFTTVKATTIDILLKISIKDAITFHISEKIISYRGCDTALN